MPAGGEGQGDSISPTRAEGLGQGSMRRAFAISVEGTDAAGRFRRVPRTLTAVGQGVIIGARRQTGLGMALSRVDMGNSGSML